MAYHQEWEEWTPLEFGISSIEGDTVTSLQAQLDALSK